MNAFKNKAGSDSANKAKMDQGKDHFDKILLEIVSVRDKNYYYPMDSPTTPKLEHKHLA